MIPPQVNENQLETHTLTAESLKFYCVNSGVGAGAGAGGAYDGGGYCTGGRSSPTGVVVGAVVFKVVLGTSSKGLLGSYGGAGSNTEASRCSRGDGRERLVFVAGRCGSYIA